MEKRGLIRHRTRVSVACSNVTTTRSSEVFEGVMLNCSDRGACLELSRRICEGSIIMVKATGWEEEPPALLPEGFRTVSVSEVKWSKPLGDAMVGSYVVGLRHLAN